MNLQELINLAGDRNKLKSFPKADGLYIWDYKIEVEKPDNIPVLHLIHAPTGQAGFKDKVSIQELIEYTNQEGYVDFEKVKVTGAEGMLIARI